MTRRYEHRCRLPTDVGEIDLRLNAGELTVPRYGLSPAIWRATVLIPPAGGLQHALGMQILGSMIEERVGTPHSEISLSQRCADCGGDHGPVRVVHPLGSYVSLSYDAGDVAAAVADVPVGVDIEHVGTFTDGSDIRPMLIGAEDWLSARGSSDFEVAELWTQKEAVLKVVGIGLNAELDQLVVERKSRGRYRGLFDGGEFDIWTRSFRSVLCSVAVSVS